jgi:uncharacterized membrane protein
MALKQRLPLLPIRIVRLHATLVLSVVVGLAVAAATPAHWRMATQLLVAWDIGVAVYLVQTHIMMACADVARIRRRASTQDEGALAILVLSIAAALASLVAIIAELGGSKQANHDQAILLGLLAAATILLSWSFMHTILTLHYAREYYGEGRDDKMGGLRFPGNGSPDYWDFLYFSLVIAMTSQVSDVAITSKSIRRVAMIHGVLSFFFNLTILALTVNMVSNLL